MKEIVAAPDLRIGMFVAELDRPWLESPFLMQGFVVEDEETLAQLRGLCRFVYVDPTRSVGDAWRAADEPPLASRTERAASLASFQVPAEVRRRPMDFFGLLRSLRSRRSDAASAADIAGILAAAGRGRTVLMVTHSAEVAAFADSEMVLT